MKKATQGAFCETSGCFNTIYGGCVCSQCFSGETPDRRGAARQPAASLRASQSGRSFLDNVRDLVPTVQHETI